MNGGPGRKLLLAVAAVLVAAAVAGCMPPAATPAPTIGPATGVRGFALAGPTCPVERPGQSPCVRAVAGAEIVARDASGRVVSRALTGPDGSFFLPLVPGRYTIEPQPVEGLMGTAQAVTVQVTAGPPLEMNLDYDTGIR